jgi:hypothetical protein
MMERDNEEAETSTTAVAVQNNNDNVVEALSRDGAVELLNNAKLSQNAEKQDELSQVVEFVVHQQPSLLAEFLPYLLEFELDKSAVVRRYIASVIELVCKKHPECILLSYHLLYCSPFIIIISFGLPFMLFFVLIFSISFLLILFTPYTPFFLHHLYHSHHFSYTLLLSYVKIWHNVQTC